MAVPQIELLGFMDVLVADPIAAPLSNQCESPLRRTVPAFAPNARWATQRRQVSWLAAQTLAPAFPAPSCERASGSFEAGSPPTVAGAATELKHHDFLPCSLLTATKLAPNRGTDAPSGLHLRNSAVNCLRRSRRMLCPALSHLSHSATLLLNRLGLFEQPILHARPADGQHGFAKGLPQS